MRKLYRRYVWAYWGAQRSRQIYCSGTVLLAKLAGLRYKMSRIVQTALAAG